MSGWKPAWDAVAREYQFTVEKSDLFDRPTVMHGSVDGILIRIEHFTDRRDSKARVSAAFGSEGPPPGIVCKRRTSAHWNMATKLHARHRRVGLWEVWANDETALDTWLTEERVAVMNELHQTAELTSAELAVVAASITDPGAISRTVRTVVTDTKILRADYSTSPR